MDHRPEGSRWSLERHERAPSLDSYGPVGRGVSEHQLLGSEPWDARPCRCGHPAEHHLFNLVAGQLGPCVAGAMAAACNAPEVHCTCRAYDPQLPGELVEAYGR